MPAVRIPYKSMLPRNLQKSPTNQNPENGRGLAGDHLLDCRSRQAELLRIEAHQLVTGPNLLRSLKPCACLDKCVRCDAPVDLVHQQHRRLVVLRDGLQEWAAEQEGL